MIEATPDSVFNGQRLVDAVLQASPDDTIHLGQGIYRLPSTLLVDRSLTLAGSGQEATRLICDAEVAVLRFTGQGRLFAADVAFVHDGDRWADTVVVDGGEVDLQRCAFMGGVFDEPNERGGAGLRILGAARGVVAQCESTSNTGSGIVLGDVADVALTGNTCRQNARSGIIYIDSATGTARDNNCTENKNHGIACSMQAGPALHSNICRGNGSTGIGFVGTSIGKAIKNICEDNGFCGIYVGEQARPTLEANTCRENKDSGLWYTDSSEGSALKNACSSNGTSGIIVCGSSRPSLKENMCEKNTYSGIRYIESGAGISENNNCDENGYHGIEIKTEGELVVQGNMCRKNTYAGIGFFGSSPGTARKNTCIGNRDGIHIAEQAHPVLEANTCRENREVGIAYLHTAAGTAVRNICEQNQRVGIDVGRDAQPHLQGNISRQNRESNYLDRRRRRLSKDALALEVSSGEAGSPIQNLPRPSAPVGSGKYESCRIDVLRVGTHRYFVADANSPALGRYTSGCSPEWGMGGWQRLMDFLLIFANPEQQQYHSDPQPTWESAVAAHKALVQLLLNDGWEAVPAPGPKWWQDTFRRPVRDPEEGWLPLISQPKWGGQWILYRPTGDEGDPLDWWDRALAAGAARSEPDGLWVTEEFLVPMLTDEGFRLVSAFRAHGDGSRLTWLRPPDSAAE